MCGISGFNFLDENLIHKMNSVLSHRGPDYAGTYIDSQINLGHVLLSLREQIDLSTQPYTQNNCDWILLFNGEIYNTKEIKKKLSLDFKNIKSDTLLIFELIKKHQWDFIHHISGMYSIVLYNKNEKLLRLYRDPSGQKCLYYYWDRGVFIFSSEIKAIMCYKKIDKSIDQAALEISCILGYIPGRDTLPQNVLSENTHIYSSRLSFPVWKTQYYEWYARTVYLKSKLVAVYISRATHRWQLT